jgi:hypothetical protein
MHQKMSSPHFENAKNAPKKIKKVRKNPKKSVLTHFKMSLTLKLEVNIPSRHVVSTF